MLDQKPLLKKEVRWLIRAQPEEKQEEKYKGLEFICAQDGYAMSSDGYRLHMVKTDMADGMYWPLIDTLHPSETTAKFPNYKQATPKSFVSSLTVNKRDLSAALKPILADKGRIHDAVTIRKSLDGKLQITTAHEEKTVFISYRRDNKAEFCLTISAVYLQDALSIGTDKENVWLRIGDNGTIVVDFERRRAKAIIMPMSWTPAAAVSSGESEGK